MFSISSKVDQDRIAAQIEDGVLTLKLPKEEEAKPRKISISQRALIFCGGERNSSPPTSNSILTAFVRLDFRNDREGSKSGQPDPQSKRPKSDVQLTKFGPKPTFLLECR